MNHLIFNVAKGNLLSTIYGMDENKNNRVFVLDSNGRLVLSSSLAIDIAVDNLDIRDLNSTRDILTVTSTDLDIRNLSGTQDSVQIYNKTYVEDSDSGTIVALGTRNFLTKNVSNYKINNYLVRNIGGVALTIALQIAPIDVENYYVNDGSSFNLLAGGSTIFTPSKLMKYARIRVSAVLLGSVTVNYFGQS